MSREENNIIPSIKQKYILRRNPSLKSRRHGEQVAPALCKYRSAAEDVAGRMMSAYIEPTIVGNGKNLSRRRRYLDGGGIRNDSYTGTKVCVCSCGCVCIFVYVCLRVERDSHDVDRGRTSVIHRESLSPLANGSSRGGDWGPDVVGDCGKGGIEHRSSIVDRVNPSCEILRGRLHLYIMLKKVQHDYMYIVIGSQCGCSVICALAMTVRDIKK